MLYREINRCFRIQTKTHERIVWAECRIAVINLGVHETPPPHTHTHRKLGWGGELQFHCHEPVTEIQLFIQ